VLEFNASDVRSKNAIVAQVSDVVRSQAMGLDGRLKKRVVIMDEVDGMGGSDRGGIPELIKVIKSSSTPIICICNDRCDLPLSPSLMNLTLSPSGADKSGRSEA
jgi:replication factor C subunit 1